MGIQHNNFYGSLILHKDYLIVCGNDPCKALLLSVLEEMMDDRSQAFIPFSYPKFQRALHGVYGRSSVINALKELEKEKIIEVKQYIGMEWYVYSYRLNIPHLQNLLNQLSPENIAKDIQKNTIKCAYCQSNEATSWDHIIPELKGGRKRANNLVPACIPCNSSKGSKDVLEWMREQGFRPSEAINEKLQILGVTINGGQDE